MLGVPATAGGYTLTTPTLPAIQAVGSAGAVALMTAVKAAGGEPRSDVTGEYLISGDQALGYTGYTGHPERQSVINNDIGGVDERTFVAGEEHGDRGHFLRSSVSAAHHPPAHGRIPLRHLRLGQNGRSADYAGRDRAGR